MTRPQTENLNAFDIDPSDWVVPGLAAGLLARRLNEDPDTGALSAVIHIPKGWTRAESALCAADQDLFLMEGALQAGDEVLQSGAFSFYPHGVVQPPWTAQEDCTAFVIFDRAPKFTVATESEPGAKTEQAVAALDTWTMDWFDPLAASKPSVAFHPGIFVKILRTDPDTGTSTHLAGLMPGWFQEGIEVHPVREESIIISGDVNIATVNGEPGYTCSVGGYYSRPPGIPHGPLSSKNGNVGLVHTEGLLGIDYQTDERAEGLILDHLRSFPWK
ncbi:MAG: DUF4437 domain-containing protein [Alphaproteobacteria bacterium]|nr:DUF4437 domain-containing protein [Alphaproteobacteria bacterium]